jgi:hypothetical protein
MKALSKIVIQNVNVFNWEYIITKGDCNCVIPKAELVLETRVQKLIEWSQVFYLEQSPHITFDLNMQFRIEKSEFIFVNCAASAW